MKKKESKGQDKCEEEVRQKETLETQIPELVKAAEELEKKRDTLLSKIGNVLTEKVPIFESEDDNRTDKLQMNNIPNDYINKIVEEQGCSMPLGFREDLLSVKCNSLPGALEHWELMAVINGVDLERGRKVAGHRG